MLHLNAIPRFSIPFGGAELLAGLRSLTHTEPHAPDPLSHIYPAGSMHWAGSGRQALYLLLKGLNLKQGSGIATPLYSDPSVFEAITFAGHRPVFVDVDERRLTLSPAALARVRDQVSAIVVPHIFGHLADIDGIQEVAAGLPLIEDAAHAPLSFYRDQPAGSFGVGCFFSFASAKYWPAGGGGVAIVRDQTGFHSLPDEARRLTRPPLFSEITTHVGQWAKAIMFTRLCYGLAGFAVRRHAEPHKLLEPHMNIEGVRRPQAAVAVRAAEGLPGLVARQRHNSLLLLSLLQSAEDVALPVEPAGCQYNYHLFPVLVRDKDERDAVRQRMSDVSVDTSKIYFDVADSARHYGYCGECPIAESVASRIITLPNYAALSEAQIHRVAATFLTCLQEARQSSRDVLTPAKTVYATGVVR